MDKKILKQLKSEYEEIEIKPSSDLWDQIENGLESSSETVQKERFQWLRYAAVILLLISIGSVFYFNSDKNSDPEKNVVIRKPSRNHLKPTEKVKPIFPDKQASNKPVLIENNVEIKTLNSALAQIQETNKVQQLLPKKEIKMIEITKISMDKIEIPVTKPLIAEHKKASYISADDLLVGRELDKTREENHNDQRKFGVFDMRKIKGPNSLKIFGFTVISDTVEDK